MADQPNDPALQQAMLLGGMYGPNPYSQFPNGIQGTAYNGTPTDAMGNPIQPTASTPGMTINTPPAAAPAAQAQPSMLQRTYLGQGTGGAAGGENAMGSGGPTGGQLAYGYTMAPQQIPGSQVSGGMQPLMGSPPMANAAPGPPQQQDNSYQRALSLLSNPGKVTTPGATVPESQPITGQPSVLDQFLSNTKSGGAGAGNYSNQGFFDTLNKLRGNLTPSTAGR